MLGRDGYIIHAFFGVASAHDGHNTIKSPILGKMAI